jgi:hypothetical protein
MAALPCVRAARQAPPLRRARESQARARDLPRDAASRREARTAAGAGHPAAREATRLADLFARHTEARIRARFRALFWNDDAFTYEVGRAVLDGRYAWLESGIVGLRRRAEELAPLPFVAAGRATRGAERGERGALEREEPSPGSSR